MLRFLLGLAVSLTIAAGAASEASAGLYPRGFFGVMVNGPLENGSVDLNAQARLMRSNGVSTWRVEFAWDLIEPTRGQYSWAATDRQVLAAAGSGIDVMGLVVRAPAWANGGSSDPFTPPTNRSDFARYLRNLVGRYGPRGSLWKEYPGIRKGPVRSWEMWNEPNLSVYFRTQPFERPYAALVRTGYAAVKSADPGAKVVLASMANYSWRDLARFLDIAGRKLRFDVAGAHPFSGRPSNAVKIVRLNREALDKRGYRKVPLWLTELTWSSAKGKKTPLTQNWETTESGQAQRLTQVYKLLNRDRRKLRLQRIFWYTWASVDELSPNSFDYSGLVQMKGDGSVRQKPALKAFRSLSRQ